MLEESLDDQLIIERVAALDIGKAELVCCVRVPDPQGSGRLDRCPRPHQRYQRPKDECAAQA